MAHQPPEWEPPTGDFVRQPEPTEPHDFTWPDDLDDAEFPDEFHFGNDGDPLYYEEEDE